MAGSQCSAPLVIERCGRVMASLLVDEGIGRDVVQELAARGYTVHHWLEFGAKEANDSLVFLEAQKRQLTVFTYNRDDFVLLAVAWRNRAHGDHFGVISRPKGQSQLPRSQLLPIMDRYCRDASSFVNRIELF